LLLLCNNNINAHRAARVGIDDGGGEYDGGVGDAWSRGDGEVGAAPLLQHI
jgi:hypothetical protein